MQVIGTDMREETKVRHGHLKRYVNEGKEDTRNDDPNHFVSIKTDESGLNETSEKPFLGQPDLKEIVDEAEQEKVGSDEMKAVTNRDQ
jgi:hypothetical protein